MRKKSASGVLASLSGSPYRKSTIRPFARCGLAGRPFCASCSVYWRGTARGAQRARWCKKWVFPQPASREGHCSSE